jgi:uncharacterized small protein (DUF1192 family)
MLDIFKRNQEGQPPAEQAPKEPEVPVQVQEEAHVAEEAPQTQEVQQAAETQEAPQESAPVEEAKPKVDDDLTVLLETLKHEETALLSQKEQLVSIGEQLRLKTVDEIEKTKERITSLKTEIPELKQKCEVMAKVLEIPVYNTAD